LSKSECIAELPQAGSEQAKPFLRWAGSKRAMLPHLRKNIPDGFGKYIEPFVGSACLYFDIEPTQAVLSDLNIRLIDTYKTVSEKPADVAHFLARMPTGSEAFYKVRANYQKLRSPISKAATFIYLNRFCFNGLYRTNQSGHFNVPYGAPRSGAVPNASDLQRAARSIAIAEIYSGDFEEVVLSHAKNNDFVYLDPPFHTSSARIFTQYNAKPFANEDFDRLVSVLREIDRRGCKFLLSYSHTPEGIKAFSKFRLTEVITRRNISGFPQHRGVARELLVRNY